MPARSLDFFKGARFIREGRQQDAQNAFMKKDLELRQRTQGETERGAKVQEFNKMLEKAAILQSKAVAASKDSGGQPPPVAQFMEQFKKTGQLVGVSPEHIDLITQQILRTPSTAEAEQAKARQAGQIKSAEREKFGERRDIGGGVISQKGDSGKESVVSKPSSPLVEIGNGRAFKIPNGFMLNDPNDVSKGIVPIPGGPADVSAPENASKIEAFKNAKKQLPRIKELLFGKNKKVDRLLLATAEGRIPGTQGRLFDSLYDTGIQAITRGETGAAMPTSELENTRKRFQPFVFDNDETIRIKFEMFGDFLDGTLKLIDPQGRFNEERFQTELEKRTGVRGEAPKEIDFSELSK